MTKEQKFYNALKDVFVGAKVEGESGYINLMRIKSRYYEKGVFPKLHEDIEKSLKSFPHFRDELFDKLYTFFSRYFSESGSIYFRYTPLHQNVYEKVYTDDKDVMLFWKTHMLYYVKTDRIFKSLEVEIDGQKFYFDVSTLEHKKANEKREIIYSLKEKRKDGMIAFTVTYSEKGKKTKVDEILKALKKNGVKLNEELLDRAFRVFERQSEVDYFINKNARVFLEEQFNLWLYQYVFSGESEWPEIRIKQLQTLKDIAFKVIAFISQFEDELVKIWNKPKFVLNSNYVITLDKIAEKNMEVVDRLLKHNNFKAQIEEWKQLGIVDDSFKKTTIIEKEKKIASVYVYLPIDTKHFKDLELEIIGLFDNLDEALDGWLIKSENYQALNTILPKFRGKVQTIYNDPPFNTGDDFEYVDRFQTASWLSLIQDRFVKGLAFLKDNGSYWLHLDDNANVYGKELIKNHFSQVTEIIFDTNATKDVEDDLFGYKSFGDNFQLKHQTLFYCRNDNNYFFRKLWKPNRSTTKMNIGWLDLIAFPNIASPKKIIDFKFKIEKWLNGNLELEDITIKEKIFPVGDIWNDIFSFTQSEMRVSESLSFTSSQKPENFLRRVIQSSSEKKHLIMDYFLGIGTTAAVAQKLGRKWIGIEMGKHIDDFYLSADSTKLGVKGRLKWVLFGDKKITTLDIDRRPHLTKDINWQGGGFFKYYEVEQYEDTLRRVKYDESDLFDDPNQDPYRQYVFLRDLKMLEALDVDLKKNKVKVDLSKLYDGIDIAETLSNLKGKWIKRITADSVEFADGEKVDLKNLDYKLIKPLIWW